MRFHHDGRRVLLVTTMAALLAGATGTAQATPFVYRPITLPRSDWALDFGLGLGHVPDVTGFGMNLELKGGLTSFLQLGIRTGFRFGRDGRAVQADDYGRMFDTETYGTDHETLANPELSLRWALIHSAAELALEGRVYIPVEDGTRLGVMVALPLALHVGGVARFDTGMYVPILFYDHTHVEVSFPLHLWFQVTNALYLGPLTGVRFHDGDTDVPFGFGLGCAMSYDIDLKTWLLFPDLNHSGGGKVFGAGVGLQVRF